MMERMANTPLEGVKDLMLAKGWVKNSKKKFWETHAFVKAAGFEVKDSIKDYYLEACKNHLLL